MAAISYDDIPTELIEVPTDRSASGVGRRFAGGAIPEADWPPTPSTLERRADAMAAERPRHALDALLKELLLWLVLTAAALFGVLLVLGLGG